MEGRAFMSALSVGIGIGVGLGVGRTVNRLASGGDSSTTGLTPQAMEREMLSLIMDGRDSKVTFYEFPYYLSEQTRSLLTSAAFVYLKNIDFSKHTRNLTPASRTILLSGPAELYQQMLAKALAHYFEAKLLLLDTTDFSLKIQSKYGASAKPNSLKRSISETTLAGLFETGLSVIQPKPQRKGGLRRQSSVADFGSTEPLQNPSNLRRNASTAANMNELASNYAPVNPAPLRRTSSWSFDEKLFVQTLYKVLTNTANNSPIVLYLRDVEKFLGRSQRINTLFEKMLKKISGPILILGSRVADFDNDYNVVDERVTSLFPYTIDIKAPEEENHLVSWKNQLQEDMKMIQFQDNRNHINEVLASNDLDCDDLGSLCVDDAIVLSKYIEEIVVSAISHHLVNTKNPNYRNGKLVISAASLEQGLSLFQEGRSMNNAPPKDSNGQGAVGATSETKPATAAPSEAEASAPKNAGSVAAPPVKEVPPDNEFEKRIRPEVIPASEIGVSFADIGALNEIKESLQELVMLPLRRPDLFVGGLLKPCRGILLFGPPGTGKTMLAKAIANEAGASFINVSMSTITSKWFGEDEKNVRALFTLAAKVSPTIIFVDEVDSMLGSRGKGGEHEAMRKIKNEFMTHWDGLVSNERILVLAATNRPFDLDEAIIRRFERRVMVGLPSVEQRDLIMRTLLSKESVNEGLDFRELANMTEGYSGSDLKALFFPFFNLCTTAAYRPVRELIQQERKKDIAKKIKEEMGDDSQTAEGPLEQRAITIRPLNIKDFREARSQVAASFAAEGSIMSELKQWNDQFGEGGSRKKEQLSYFLTLDLIFESSSDAKVSKL
ncbi:ATPase, AAA-type, core, P-loop containing nucleoside triphosphate hydrolase [Artemisia annua]|uniref:ATPase, AAA-type, core, P-loop containing nucleoside triphosphate hydrolase n=1 Tax=Artemisia annua TaxID=35608 RepID=A0A2U1MZ33_ARTAN|nr:ATPase, AAA-type, core, P-loop containing nucleoside triphosphate hydrolase [Artemisia annua]